MKPKIPPDLQPEVLRLAGEGKTSEEIAQHLWRVHAVEVDSSSVRKFIKRRRDELADVSKAVVREEMRKELLPAVRALRGIRLRARFAEKCAQIEGDVLAALKAQDRQMKAIFGLFHYSGLNQPDQPGKDAPPVQDLRAALEKRIRDLITPPEPSVH